MDIQNIISAIQEHRIRITDHADEESQADALTFDEIFFSVLQGEVIEDYPTDKPYPSVVATLVTPAGNQDHPAGKALESRHDSAHVGTLRVIEERYAALLATEGMEDGSVAILRVTDTPYRGAFKRIELREVAAQTKHMPPGFLSGTNDVSARFLDYARPLVGDLPETAWI